jgi:cyanophycinase
VNSAATLVVQTRSAAADPFVLATVNAAEAIFFAGGDQWAYRQTWAGTPLNDAVLAKMQSVPIGGTSAGAMVGRDSGLPAHA